MSHTYREPLQRRHAQAKRRLYRAKMRCADKRCFSDEIAARVAGMVSIGERGNLTKLWIYPCPHCKRWHLTSQDRGRQWLVTAQEPVAA